MFDFNGTNTKQQAREIFNMCRNPYRTNAAEEEIIWSSLPHSEKVARLKALQATWKPRIRRTATAAQLIPLKTAKIIPFPAL